MKIVLLKAIENEFKHEPDAFLWTAIVPAAGRGSRLGYSKPKILYPIAGRPMLDWLIDLLEPYCAKVFFVLSPSGFESVSPLLGKRLPGKFAVAIQDEPRGMADAIWQAVPKLSTSYTLIIWGDQVAIRPATLRNIMKLQQYSPGTKFTMPIVRRENSYVHYATDLSGRFTHVLEKREGALMPPVGESDCGLFAFETSRLQQVFQLEREKGIAYSQALKEWNFLPMLPQFETGDESVKAMRLESLEETVGINDVNDAALLENYFRQLSTV